MGAARDELEGALDAACPTDEGRRLIDAHEAEVLARFVAKVAGRLSNCCPECDESVRVLRELAAEG